MAKTKPIRVGKQAFIDQVNEKVNEIIELHKKDTTIVVNAVLDAIAENMAAKNSIVIPGFGTFSVTHMKKRKGRNISNGSEIVIPAHDRVKFSAGKTLKETVEHK